MGIYYNLSDCRGNRFRNRYQVVLSVMGLAITTPLLIITVMTIPQMWVQLHDPKTILLVSLLLGCGMVLFGMGVVFSLVWTIRGLYESINNHRTW